MWVGEQLRDWRLVPGHEPDHTPLGVHLRRGEGLIFFGPKGTGKSSAAAMICGEVVQMGKSVEWITHSSILNGLDQGKDAAEKLIKKLTYPKLLVIDDFGVVTMADWQVERFDALVEARYGWHRSTIITTNLSEKRLAADTRMDRALDRWRQKNRGVIIRGESRREPLA